VARAIIRYSFAAEEKQRRTALRDGLRAAGFIEIGTALYERSAEPQDLVEALTAALAIVAETDDEGFDHLWLCMDSTGTRPGPELPSRPLP
jgi:hypothetical protein